MSGPAGGLCPLKPPSGGGGVPGPGPRPLRLLSFQSWTAPTLQSSSARAASTNIGGTFSAWDGYISGSTLELVPNQRIVQAWRTSEFPDDAPDSRVEILLEEVESGTKLTFIHSNMPEGQTETYRQGWHDFYYQPMKAYFGKR